MSDTSLEGFDDDWDDSVVNELKQTASALQRKWGFEVKLQAHDESTTV